MALLDRLLSHVDLSVSPFAVCDVRSGSRLRLPGEHQANMHFVMAGHGELLAGKMRHPLEAYCLVLVPPGLAHSIEPGERDEELAALDTALPEGVERVVSGSGTSTLIMACGRLRAELSTGGLFERLTHPLVENFSDSERVRSLFDQLFEEQRLDRPGRVQMIQSVMMQCLVHLLRRVCDSKLDGMEWLMALEDPSLGKAIDLMLKDPGAPLTLDGLAIDVGMSRSSFSAKFQEAFGRSPMAFLREVRMKEAAKLLRTTDLPVKSIAARVGFSSRSHFSRAFKEQYQRDPANFRGTDD